ncbi:MAG: ThiF family adenylyltransferase [Clostridia bacterium]|nr:ThiF family adenylyltransferase [Clostridia bacterium]
MIKGKTQGFSLKKFTAAVIGVGGLGCNIATHLAGAGIGRLLLFDFDKISETNLNRQFLYTKDSIGEDKVFEAKKRLEEYSETVCKAYNIKITENNIPEELKTADIIFLAADNLEARKALTEFSEENKIPLVFGGIDGFYGKTYLYIPNITPCPECAGIIEGGKTKSNISAAAGIIGSLQAALGIQYLLTKDISLGGKITVYDSDTFSSLKIISSPKCKTCKNIQRKKDLDD